MQRLATEVRIILHDTRQLSVVIVIIKFTVQPPPTARLQIEVHLAMPAVHPTVGTTLTSLVNPVAQRERIIILGINIFSQSRNCHTLAQ